jgi:cupin fold WbuC family metalloprotein
VKRIDNALLDSLIAKAKDAPRKRANFNLHPGLTDPVQRLCIAMEPETYVRPHRHSDTASWEVLLILRGSLALLLFDDKGAVLERTVLSAGGPITAIEFPQDTWHVPVSLEPGTVVFEIKQGPYKPIAEINSASWAPAEGNPGVEQLHAWYKTATTGELPPKV